MGNQNSDTTELQALVDAMNSLVNYCDALQSGASGFAYMLPAEWQGPAMSRFLAAFSAWSAGAGALTTQAEALRDQAKAARDAYDSAIESADELWSTIEKEMS